MAIYSGYFFFLYLDSNEMTTGNHRYLQLIIKDIPNIS